MTYARINSGKKKGTVTPVIPTPTAKAYTEKQSRRVSTPIVADSSEFIPEYKTKGAACCDLKASIPPDINGNRILRLMPGHTQLVDCGFSMALPAGYEAQIRAKSGWASKGIIVTNATDEQEGGTIDDDYRLRIKVILTNVGKQIININHMERVAQMAVKPVWYFDFDATDHLEDAESDRVGGFGSTGVK